MRSRIIAPVILLFVLVCGATVPQRSLRPLPPPGVRWKKVESWTVHLDRLGVRQLMAEVPHAYAGIVYLAVRSRFPVAIGFMPDSFHPWIGYIAQPTAAFPAGTRCDIEGVHNSWTMCEIELGNGPLIVKDERLRAGSNDLFGEPENTVVVELYALWPDRLVPYQSDVPDSK